VPVLDALVQRAKTGSVDAVYVDGEVVYEDGRFTRVDRETVLAEIAAALATPRTDAEEDRRRLGREILPYVRGFYEGWLADAAPTPFYAGSSRT
jgi:5-methylthioadenosine/S-adenosylhomocysteine deaminase